MSYYKIPLTAGVAYRHDVQGTLLLIDDLGVASGVDVTLLYNGSEGVTMPGRKVAFRLVQPYDAVILQSAVDTTVALFLSGADVQLGFTSGLAVTVPDGVKVTNNAAERVPVDVGGGAINVTATEVGINNDDTTPVPVRNQSLSNIVHSAPVSVGVAATSLGAADATLRKLIFRNDHATAVVAIGGAGVTLDNGPIVLQPGDIWEERDAPGIEWFAISDTAATNVQVMGMK